MNNSNKGGMGWKHKTGGSTARQRAKVEKVMREFKEGKLHSGSKKGPIVKDRDQAIAIALSEAGMSKKMALGGGVDKDILKVGGNWNPKQIANISKIAKKVNAIDFMDYSTGGGFESLALMLPNKTILNFDSEDGLQGSKITYENLKDDFYNDENYENYGWIPDVSISENFSNVDAIVKAINTPEKWVFAYAHGGGVGKYSIDDYDIERLQEKGLTIKQMNDVLMEKFPDSFGFTLYPIKDNSPSNYRNLIPDTDDYYGIKDDSLKISFDRNHNMSYRIYQGGENTYFYFILDGSDGNGYIGSFGFKDQGDVPKEYVTSFTALLSKLYGFPFKVSHEVYADGGGVEKGRSGRYHILGEIKGKQPVLYASTNDKNKISDLKIQASKDLFDLTGVKHEIFVTDSLEDRELYGFAKGGGLSSFNPRSFTLDELKDYLWKNEIWISYFKKGQTGITSASETKIIWDGTSNASALKEWKNKKLTISDYGQLEVDKGYENMYMTLVVYELDGSDDPYEIRIYSKDNHAELRKFANYLIEKFKTGGSTYAGGGNIKEGERISFTDVHGKFGLGYYHLDSNGKVQVLDYKLDPIEVKLDSIKSEKLKHDSELWNRTFQGTGIEYHVPFTFDQFLKMMRQNRNNWKTSLYSGKHQIFDERNYGVLMGYFDAYNNMLYIISEKGEQGRIDRSKGIEPLTKWLKDNMGIDYRNYRNKNFNPKGEYYARGGKVSESDITPGTKFKAKSGVVFIVDEIKDGMVHSSLEGGEKGNYRDPIGDFVDFMNEMEATRVIDQGGVITKSDVSKMQKINIRGFEAYMPGIRTIYFDQNSGKFFYPFDESEFFELKNDYTLGKLNSFLKEKNITLKTKMAQGGSMYAGGGWVQRPIKIKKDVYKFEDNRGYSGWKHKMAKGAKLKVEEQYHPSKYLTKEQWEKWNEWVKTGKIDGKKENNIFAVARWVGASSSNINAYEIEQRAKKLK